MQSSLSSMEMLNLFESNAVSRLTCFEYFGYDAENKKLMKEFDTNVMLALLEKKLIHINAVYDVLGLDEKGDVIDDKNINCNLRSTIMWMYHRGYVTLKTLWKYYNIDEKTEQERMGQETEEK